MPPLDDERITSFIILAISLTLVTGLIASRFLGVETAIRWAQTITGIVIATFGATILIVTAYRHWQQRQPPSPD